MRQLKENERRGRERSHTLPKLTSQPVRARSEMEKDREQKEKERVLKRGSRESRASAQGRAGLTRSKIRAGKGGREGERMEKTVKYHFIASLCGGHIQMCLCAEWVQDHIEKIIEGMTEGKRL